MRRGRLVAIGVAVACGAGALASPAAATAPSWWGYDRKAQFTTSQSDVFVTVRDGTPIHCKLNLPALNGAPAPGRFPALIESYTPYGATNGPSASGGDDYWADRGYVSTICDIRGTGYSGGVWQGLLSALENQDNFDLLAWMRSQLWSNGVLGQTGVSYGGFTSMRVASLHPSGLEAILPVSAEDDLYREDIYPGGIKSTPGPGDFWPAITVALSGGRELAALTYAQYLQHPTWDDFWRQISMSTKWSKIDVPILGLGGFNDTLVPGGTIADWVGLRAAGKKRNYVIMGPWTHASTGPPFALPQGAQLAWFDHWLKRLPGAPLPSAPVTSFQQPLTEAGSGAGRGWRSFPSWPPPGTRPVDWALNAGGRIARQAAPAATASFTTLPTDHGDTGVTDNGTVPPDERPDQTLTFDTVPLLSDVQVAGRVVVNLRAALDQTDGNLKAVLYDVGPDGTATFIQEGYLKAGHRISDANPMPVTPGAVTSLPIEIFPTDWRFGKGHRIRLRVYGGHATELIAQPEPVTTTVALGQRGSTVTLPELG